MYFTHTIDIKASKIIRMPKCPLSRTLEVEKLLDSSVSCDFSHSYPEGYWKGEKVISIFLPVLLLAFYKDVYCLNW